jgi:hypothetical protein
MPWLSLYATEPGVERRKFWQPECTLHCNAITQWAG